MGISWASSFISLIFLLNSTAWAATQNPDWICNYFLSVKRYRGVSIQVLKENTEFPNGEFVTQVKILDVGTAKKTPFKKGDVVIINYSSFPGGTGPELKKGAELRGLDLGRTREKTGYDLFAPLDQIPKVASFGDWMNLQDLTRHFIVSGYDSDISEAMGLVTEEERFDSLKDGVPKKFQELFPKLRKAISQSALPRREGIHYALRTVALADGTVVGGELRIEYETLKREYSSLLQFNWDAETQTMTVTIEPERFEAG